MSRTVLLPFLAIVTVGMSGCAAHHNGGEPGAAPAAMVITRPTPAPASNINPGASGATIVQLGDVLAVSVAEDPSFNGYYEVRLGGYIILPAVGRIDAMGLRLKVVQANVIRALEETQLPHATVKVTELRNTRNGY